MMFVKSVFAWGCITRNMRNIGSLFLFNYFFNLFSIVEL
jgi:hypothetical protein